MPASPDPYAESRAHFVYYLSSAVASVLCVVLLYLAVQEARGVQARRHGVRLRGTVTQRREVHSSSSSRSKRAISVGTGSTTLEYTVAASYQGQPVQVVNHFRTSLDEYRAGDAVPIVYVPGHPEHSRFATWTEQYGQLVQLLGFGLLCGVAASLLWMRRLTAGALLSRPPKLPPGSIG